MSTLLLFMLSFIAREVNAVMDAATCLNSVVTSFDHNLDSFTAAELSASSGDFLDT